MWHTGQESERYFFPLPPFFLFLVFQKNTLKRQYVCLCRRRLCKSIARQQRAIWSSLIEKSSKGWMKWMWWCHSDCIRCEHNHTYCTCWLSYVILYIYLPSQPLLKCNSQPISSLSLSPCLSRLNMWRMVSCRVSLTQHWSWTQLIYSVCRSALKSYRRRRLNSENSINKPNNNTYSSDMTLKTWRPEQRVRDVHTWWLFQITHLLAW